MTLPHLVGILPHRHISHVMYPILDCPVSSPHLLYLLRTPLFPTQTGYAIRDFLAYLPSLHNHSTTCATQHLLRARPIQVSIHVFAQCPTTLQRACLQSPMPFLHFAVIP